MKELANNLDIINYCKEISQITGISVLLVQKIIMYAMLTSKGPWYYTFESIIDNLINNHYEENITSDTKLMAI